MVKHGLKMMMLIERINFNHKKLELIYYSYLGAKKNKSKNQPIGWSFLVLANNY